MTQYEDAEFYINQYNLEAAILGKELPLTRNLGYVIINSDKTLDAFGEDKRDDALTVFCAAPNKSQLIDLRYKTMREVGSNETWLLTDKEVKDLYTYVLPRMRG